jgi:hypothetical protein
MGRVVPSGRCQTACGKVTLVARDVDEGAVAPLLMETVERGVELGVVIHGSKSFLVRAGDLTRPARRTLL